MAPTPGFNRRVGIFFDLNAAGKRLAYYWAPRQFRAFRMPLADADRFIAEGAADHLSCHPLRGPRG